MFPGNLLPYTFRDPNDRGRVQGRTEIERRATHIERLEICIAIHNQALVDLVKQCLDDSPEDRPSSEDLLQQILIIKKEVERSYGGSSLKYVDVGRVQLAKDIKVSDLNNLHFMMYKLLNKRVWADIFVVCPIY